MAIDATWFSIFLENAFVSLVNPSHLHPHGKILTLHKAGGNMLRVRVTESSAISSTPKKWARHPNFMDWRA